MISMRERICISDSLKCLQRILNAAHFAYQHTLKFARQRMAKNEHINFVTPFIFVDACGWLCYRARTARALVHVRCTLVY